jgi:predicted O-methyltransferase YrrM
MTFKSKLKFPLKYLFALVSGLYLFTFGIFRARDRALITMIGAHFGLRLEGAEPSKKIEPIIPEIDPSEIFTNDAELKVLEPKAVAGNMSIFQMALISNLIVTHKPQQIFEIGTFDGRTTLNMSANSLPESKIFTLDLPKTQLGATGLPLGPEDALYVNKDKSGSRFSDKIYANKIIQLYGDSATFDFSPYFNSIDLVFVDGAHSYEYVMNDSQIALRLLRYGRGIILWDDYGNWAGVTRALNELYLEKPEFRSLRQIKGTILAYLIVER